MWHPRDGDLELIKNSDADYMGYKVDKKHLVHANFLDNLLCHGLPRSKKSMAYPLLRLNILPMKHVVLKYYGLANNSETLD